MSLALNKKLVLLNTLSKGLSIQQCNQIPLLVLDHPIGKATISLQGAQLLSWKPHFAKEDILWLSEEEPFILKQAIRGGIPICYPWFNNFGGPPAHGTARISLWQLEEYQIKADQIQLTFSLFSTQNTLIAKLAMIFTDTCTLHFTHYDPLPAQLALHSYFNIANIEQTHLSGLPTQCYNFLTQDYSNVLSPLPFNQAVDYMYSIKDEVNNNYIADKNNHRTIKIEHINASNVVVWNPWHNTPSNMPKEGYQTMLCVETARIEQKLQATETVSVRFSLVL